MNNVNVIFFLVMSGLIFSLSKNIFSLLFSLDNYSIHKKRLKQLKYESEKEELTTYQAIEKYMNPVVTNVFPKIEKIMPSLGMANIEQLRMDLKMAKWDDTFSPESFIALGLVLKTLAIVAIMLTFPLGGKLRLVGIIWAIGLFGGLDYMFKGSLKGRKATLFNDFPDFIRITSGYLSADVPLVQAVTDAIKYVGDEWKPILQQFVVECDTKGIDTALNNLRINVDLFEVKEFVALVRLTLEQGGNVKDGFLAQAEKITEMQKNLLLIRIGRRKTMSTVLQGPLLLCNMVVLALPTVGNVTNML